MWAKQCAGSILLITKTVGFQRLPFTRSCRRAPSPTADHSGNRFKWRNTAPQGYNTSRKSALPMQLRSAADGTVLQVSPSVQPSRQIQDPSHATTADDNLPQELASSVTRRSTGRRTGPELIRHPRRETLSSYFIHNVVYSATRIFNAQRPGAEGVRCAMICLLILTLYLCRGPIGDLKKTLIDCINHKDIETIYFILGT